MKNKKPIIYFLRKILNQSLDATCNFFSNFDFIEAKITFSLFREDLFIIYFVRNNPSRNSLTNYIFFKINFFSKPQLIFFFLNRN